MTQILWEENIKKKKTSYKKVERNISVLVFALLLPNFEPVQTRASVSPASFASIAFLFFPDLNFFISSAPFVCLL